MVQLKVKFSPYYTYVHTWTYKFHGKKKTKTIETKETNNETRLDVLNLWWETLRQ